MARSMLRAFSECKLFRQILASRSFKRACQMAKECGGEPASMHCLSEGIAKADIVISASGAGAPILTKSELGWILMNRRQRRLVIFDVAVPRDMDPDIRDLPGVSLYDLDDLQKSAGAAAVRCLGSAEAARQIISQHVEQYLERSRMRQIAPIIEQLRTQFHTIAQDELARTLSKMPNLDEAQRDQLRTLARRIAGKVAHEPIRTFTRLQYLNSAIADAGMNAPAVT